MQKSTEEKELFDNNLVVSDAMIIIHFHNLVMFEQLISWANGKIVLERNVVKEIKRSKMGPIDLNPYFSNGRLISQDINGEEQENLFFDYITDGINGKKIHKGEAASLVLAISNDYGLACDERDIINEFKLKCPGKFVITSFGIIDKARSLGFISEQQAEDMKEGITYF